ncbi:MAG: cytochrome c3 family protein [Planctomycetota bacterium]
MKLRNVIFFMALLAMAMSTQVWADPPAGHTAGGCAGCHSAHNAAPDTLELLTVPLWSGDLAVGSSFTPYTSLTMDATVGDPDGDSLMCLSCHDGSGTGVSGVDNLGIDLTDDHPISFVYDTALATPATGDDNLHDPAIELVPGGAGGETIEAEWLDSAGKIQCTTCHDVHNNNIHDTMLLREPVATLCSVCHRQ